MNGRAHPVSLPDLPPEPSGADDDGERSSAIDHRFTQFVRSMNGDWKLDDEFAATREADGILHHLQLSAESETLEVSVSPVVSERGHSACGFVGLVNAAICLYVGHDVLMLRSRLGMLAVLTTCFVVFMGTWMLLVRALFVWPHRRKLGHAFIMLDDEVKTRLGTTPGIISRT